jgi:GAF domain-containing protein
MPRLANFVAWIDSCIARGSERLTTWARLDPGRHEPGFLGPLPYALILRWLIVFATALRLYTHWWEYTADALSLRVWHIVLYGLMSVVASFFVVRPAWRHSRSIQVGIIVADLIFISIAYWLTGVYGSDFFLFYYLPIFEAVEYFGLWGAVAISVCVGFAMVMVALGMHTAPSSSHTGWPHVFRVLFVRWLFLLAVATASTFILRRLSRRQTELLTLLDALHKGAAAVPGVQELDQILESILSELTEQLKFECATISLVDDYRNCIETVRGRNVSPGWVMRAKHSLDVPDIQTHVVNTGETKVIIGWDDLLDKGIYDRFEHWRLARVWAPIVVSDKVVIGTVEAGCDKERADEILTEAAIQRVMQLGRERGNEIGKRRPHVLLEDIAKNAIQFIGADSASVHVYRRTGGAGSTERWGELVLAAGAGKATPDYVRSDKPSERGRGRRAIETGKPVWLDDPLTFEADYPKLYDMGVRALAVIPLKLGSDNHGILGIHFWRTGKKITSHELNLAEMFAREMEGVIQNYLLLTRATEAGSRAWALSGLQSLMQSLTSPFSLPDVLQKVAKNALLTLDADSVAVYQYAAEKDSFYFPPVTDGEFLTPTSMNFDVRPDKTLVEFVRHGASQFIIDVLRHRQPDLATSLLNGVARFVEREAIESCAVLVLRPSELSEISGLLFVNYRHPHQFSNEEKMAMDALATSAALAIRNARLHKDDLDKQLGAMSQVHAAIADKGPDLTVVLQALLQQTLTLTGAKYGACMRWDEHAERLEPIARWPDKQDYSIAPQKIDEGIVGLAAKSRTPILVEDVSDQQRSILVERVGKVLPAAIYKRVNPDTRSEIAVPLLDGDQLLGVINIEHPEIRGLNPDHRVLLQTLAVPAIIAFHTVDLYKRLERPIRHLSALNFIAARVQEKPYELDAILRFFLTGITAGSGLGFSRAMLFFVDDGRLRGEAAIGPISRDQAEAVWNEFERVGTSSKADLDRLLQAAEQLSDETTNANDAENLLLTQAIRRLSFPIDYAAGAAAECLSSGKIVLVKYNQDNPFRDILATITHPNDVKQAFAAVPLVGKLSGQIGVLIVDNRFLWKERSLNAEDIEGLEAFASLMALSIETIRLQQRLAEEQRVENWREVTGSIAHTMGTILFEVRGALRELNTRLFVSQLAAPDEVRPILKELSDGIGGAEKILWDFRNFASPPRIELERVDLRKIVTDVFQPTYGDCIIEVDLPDNPLIVLADAFKLSNALRDIRKNAQEAMVELIDEPKLITVRATTIGADMTSQAYTQLEIIDSGPGLSAAVKQRMFQPYLTTKRDGSGLGLANARKVIAAHNGTIQADNSSNRGARFVLRLPLVGYEEGLT